MPDHTSAAVDGGSSPDGRLCTICDEDFPCAVQQEHQLVSSLMGALAQARACLTSYIIQRDGEAQRGHILNAASVIDAALDGADWWNAPTVATR